MSSSGFSPSLAIDRPGCHRVQALILCTSLLALGALGYGGLPGPLQVLAAVLVVGSGLREFRRASPRSPYYVARILVTADGRFLLGLGRDPATLQPAVVVNYWNLPGVAMGLAFAGGEAQRTEVILFRDRVPPDAWRRLTVRLRHAVCTGH
ncbi:MAG: hypothetical protein JNK40_13360 [Chromatiales bacterium]|nr:hypothetical protein [Chromatiales bacterium]